MGDEIDGLDLPIHHQSGNMDTGHASSINSQELAEQSGQLNSVLENYYDISSGVNFNTVLDNIEDLGYTEERARTIRNNAQIERTYREQNNGIPSELTPNQLAFFHGDNHLSLIHI